MIVSPEVSQRDMLTIQAGINAGILSLPASKVAVLEDVSRQELIGNIMRGVSETMKPDVDRRLRRYLDFEWHIQGWVDNTDFTKPEEKGNIFAGITKEQIPEEYITATRVERIHGGIALIVPPEVFQRVVIKQVSTADATLKQDKPSDRKAIANHIRSFPEMGFSFDAPEHKGFPPGMHIVLVTDSDDSEAIQRVIQHETLERLSLLFESHPTLRRRGTSEIVRSALSDLAARLEVNLSTPEELDLVTLGMLGISQTEGNAHELEAGTVAYILGKARERFKALQDISHAEERKRAQVLLAQEIRYGANDPIDLLTSWNVEDAHEQIAAKTLRPEDYYGRSGNIPHFTARSEFRNGRFVYCRPTLRERRGNEALLDGENMLRVSGRDYKVVKVLPRTGHGGVYILQDANTGLYAFGKELLYPIAEVLLDSTKSALDWFDTWVNAQQLPFHSTTSLNNALFGLIDTTMRQPDEYEKVEQALRESLFTALSNTPQLAPIYKGTNEKPLEFQQRTSLEPIKAYVFDAVRDALVLFTNRQEVLDARRRLHEAKKAFQDEVDILAYLTQHNVPHIPHVYDIVTPYGADNPASNQYNNKIIVSEFLPGDSLSELIRTRQIVPDPLYNNARIIGWIIQLLGIEDAYHKAGKGIVHRDISLHNLMIDSQNKDRISLVDFGNALDLNRKVEDQRHGIGTIGYASPEQFNAPLHVDHRSDIYATGKLLGDLLTDNNSIDVAEDRMNRHLDPFDTLDLTKIQDAELRRIVAKAISRNMYVRYQSADEMREDLRNYLAGQSTMPMPTLPPTP